MAADPSNALEFYQPMFSMLLEQPQYLTQLCQLIDHADHETVAQIIVHMSTPFGRLTQHMRSLILAEFEQAPDPSSILRRNSVASRVMAILARRIGPDFMNTYFGDLVRKLVDNETINLEVDPGHTGEEGVAKLTLTELKENKRQLLRFCTKVFNKICSDDLVNAMPREFKAIGFFIAQYARKTNPDKVNALIGSFVMLRLFNPMLIAPQTFGLVPKKRVPSARARRNMLLITKVMQNLANGQLFGAKEDYMLDLNPWIEKNKAKMEHYLSLMASDGAAPPDAAFADLLSPTTRSDVARAGLDLKDLQFVHWLLFSHREALEKHFAQQADFRALLAQLGAPPTLKVSTPLYQAAMEDNIEEMKHLIVHKSDLRSTIKSDPEWHPLQWCLDHAKRDESAHYQLEHRYLDLSDLLLHHGLDARCISKAKGYTPLHKFVRIAWKDRLVHLRIMSCMVVRGRDINFPAVGDETALHLAAQEGVDDSVAFLLANGADPNLRNQRGDTPLHLAVQNGNLRAVTLMLEAGAQTNLRGSIGKTPKDLAEQFKRPEIAKLLNDTKGIKVRNVAANARLQPNTGEFVPIAHHLHEPSLSVYTNQEGLNAKTERSTSAPAPGAGPGPGPAPIKALPAVPARPAAILPVKSVRELNWAAADTYYSAPARLKRVVRVQAHARRWLARRYLRVARQRREQKKALVENMVVDELTESERAYVRDLQMLIKAFVEPLRFAPKPLVSAEELKVLFLEVEALYAANQKFLLLLSAFPNPRTSLSLTEVFANLCNYLKAYHNYYRNHPHAVALLARLQKSNKDFDAFLTSVAVQPDVRYDLKTYLTKPIMRASLYPLLLDKMLRRIPATHIEFDGLTAVHAKMKQLVDGLDESLRRSENQIQIADIADRISGKSDLIAPHRTLLREGDLGVVQSVDKLYRCFLFNDVLLLTILCKAQSRQSIFGGKKAGKAPAQFEVKHQFEMSNATVVDVADMEPASGFLHAFQIVYQPDQDTLLSYTFLSATAEDKALWMRAFMRCPIRNLARSA